MNFDKDGRLTRRGFVAGTAASGLILPGQAAFARGGGGGEGGFDLKIDPSLYSDEEGTGNRPQVYTQQQFLRFSRNRLNTLMVLANVYIIGFTLLMSQHLLRMGYYNQHGTRKIVRVMIKVTVVRERRVILREARDEARADLNNYSGSDSGFQSLQAYYNGLRYWSSRPKEGTLSLNYKF